MGLMVGNIGLWPAKMFEWRKVTKDLRNGRPLEMLMIVKLIKIKVLLHQFSTLMFNLQYMCLNFALKNIQSSFIVTVIINNHETN